MSAAMRAELRMVYVPPAPQLARLGDRVAELTAAEELERSRRKSR